MQELLEKIILVTTMPNYFKYKTTLIINVRAVAAVLSTLVMKNTTA